MEGGNLTQNDNFVEPTHISEGQELEREEVCPLKIAQKNVVKGKSQLKISYEELNQLFEENDDIFEMVCEAWRRRQMHSQNKNANSSASILGRSKNQITVINSPSEMTMYRQQ